MRRHRTIAAAVLLALLVSLCTVTPVMASDTNTPEYDGYIMKLRDDAFILLSDDGPEQVAFCDGVYLIDDPNDARPYIESGLVEYIEPNYILELLDDYPNDPNYSEQWTLDAIEYPVLYKSGKNGAGVTVAVIDSGLYAWTEGGQYYGQEDFASISISSKSRNFLGQDAAEYYYRDQKGHGTFVASQVAAKAGNVVGISGVSDGVNLMILRCIAANSSKTFPFDAAIDSNSGSAALVASAIRYAADNGADVINLSLGSSNAGSGVTLGDALAYASGKGVILVAAAGNAGSSAVYYPAGNESVIGVGSVDKSLERSSFSQYNSSIDVTAPGGRVYGANIYSDGTGNALSAGYASGSGTSYAAPVISALAAIVKEYNEALDHDDFMSLLATTSTDKGAAGKDNYYGYGVANARALLAALDAEYSIEYILNDQNDSPATMPEGYASTYTLGRTQDVVLPIPTRDGYAFTGWYELPQLDGEPTAVLPKGALAFAKYDQNSSTYSIPPIKYYAGWESYDAAKLSSVTVKGYTAELSSDGASYSVKLPKGSIEAVSSLSTGDFEIHCADKSAQVSGLSSANGGFTWSFRVNAGASIEKNYTITVTLSELVIPTASAAERSGTALLASVDGKKAASAYTADVSQWFDNETEYSVIENSGSGIAAVNGSSISYLPGDGDFKGQSVTLTVGAANADFKSDDTVALTVEIGRAQSNSTAAPAAKELDIYTDTAFNAELTLYDNTLVSVSAGTKALSEGVDYTLSDGELDSTRFVEFTEQFLKGLTQGNVSINFKFSGGEDAAIALTVTDSAPRYAVKYYLESTDKQPYSTASIRTGSTIGTLPANPTKEGSSFTGWYLKDKTTRITANTKILAALDVYAAWLADGTSGGGTPGDGTPGGGTPGGSTSAAEYTVNISGIEVPVHMEETSAVLELTDDEIALLLSNKNGVSVDISAIEEADSVLIPSALLLARVFEIKTKDGTIVLDRKTLAGLSSRGGDLTVSVKCGKDNNGRIVFSLTSFLNGSLVTEFDGTVTANLPYSLKDGESAENVIVALRTQKGIYEQTDCQYDRKSATATVRLKHFSDYVITVFPFDDVGTQKWYYGSVLNAYLNGVFEGDTPRSFAPAQTTNRAMFVTALWRMEESPLPKGPAGFKDVPQGSWYSSAVAWASENGIVDGYSSNYFGPLDELNREQMMTILYRYEKYKGGGYSEDWTGSLGFSDASSVSDWAYEAVCWCTMKGIVDGVGDNMLLPSGKSDRAQLAAVLSRYASQRVVG